MSQGGLKVKFRKPYLKIKGFDTYSSKKVKKNSVLTVI